MSRFAEELRLLKREPPQIDAQTRQMIEALHFHLATLQAERARKARNQNLRPRDMEKPGDYWTPEELERLRKRTVTEPKG